MWIINLQSLLSFVMCQEPMHLSVSSNDELSYRRSCEMVEQLIAGVYADYSEWCRGKGLQVPHINLICVEGELYIDVFYPMNVLEYLNRSHIGIMLFQCCYVHVWDNAFRALFRPCMG